MIRRFYAWLLRQGIAFYAIGSFYRVNRRLSKLEREREYVEDRLHKRLQKLEELQRQLVIEADKLVEDKEKVDLLVKKYEQELESLRCKVYIFENDERLTLIAANRRYREMWAAEAAVHARQQKINTLPKESAGYD